MKILVTGAGGFIGRYLCAHLSSQGHSVKAVVRRPPMQPLQAAEVCIVPELSAIDDGLFQDCNCVIHLAARAHILKEKTADPLPEFREVNVNMARRLVEKAGKNGVKRFVLVSSLGVNGPVTCGIPFSEAMAAAPAEPYAISKLEAEDSVRTSAKALGIEYVIVRPPLVYGPDAPGNFALLLKLMATGIPLPFAGVKAKRNLISVWNLADFLLRCCEHPSARNELFLVADREEIALPEIFQYLGQGFGKQNPLFHFPLPLLSMSARLAGKGKAFDKLVAELRVDSTKAQQFLNWLPPYTALEGLQRTGKLYKSLIHSTVP